MVDGTFAFRLLSLAISLAFGVSSAQSCFTYNCGFEGPCLFETGYTGHRNIQWQVHQGGTPSTGTGPTSGYGGIGSYIFMESSDPVNTGDTTWLSLPAAGYLGEVCLEFAYHMRGEHMGRLDLYTKEGSTSQSNVLWSMQGDQGPNWLAENITVLLPSNNSQITFHGVKGQDYRGDIALDSINVTCGRCGEVAAAPTTTPIDEQPSTVVVMTTDDSASPSVTPDTRTTEDVSSDRPCYRYFCDFETTCDNRTGYDGQNPGIEWRLNNGSTSSARTGPSSGYGGFGSYIYMETSGPDPFDSTWFAIPASGDAGLMCVQFAYHMYGDQMGSLSLLVAEPSLGSQNRVWSMGGNHGNAWMMSRLTVEIPTSRSQLTWIGIRGSGFRSDIALDEILVECGPCNDSTTTPYTTLRPYNTTSPTASTSTTSSYVTDDDACSSYFCDFERPCLTYTGFTGTNPSIQWRRHRGSTSSSSTGPRSGYGGFGYYLYMETSGSGPGSTWLTIPASGYIGPVCVAFAYHMYGAQMGRLQLYASDPTFGTGPPLWSMTGNQGNVWWIARVTAMMPTSQARVTWVGIKGSGYRSDIALDMISVQCGACDDSTSSPYTTPRPHFTTTPNYPDTTTTTPSPGLNVSIPDSYVVKRSDSVTVTCFLYVNTACSSNVIFDWVYPSNTQIQEHHQGFAMQTFYSLQPSYFFSVLTVTSSNYWLTGVYTCRVTFDGLTISQRAVIVIYPQGYPQASTTSHPFTTTTNIGGSFTYPTITSTTYSTSQTPTAGYVQVRLVGRYYYEGRLEVTYNGVWGTVCDDGFTSREATMFCRMLGYSEAGEVLSTLLYSPGSGNIWLDEINCRSTSRQIYDCSHSGWGNHDCTHGEDVGIRCPPYNTGVYASSTYPTTTTPNTPGNVIVRLVGGSSIYEGRLEVRYNGIWGTVCDDSFSNVDAAVFCRMLNYSETGRVLSRNEYVYGRGPIWLDDVGCRTYHRHINECYHRTWGLHNCGHSEDVGIGCYPTISDIRLSDGNRSSEGRLEVRYNAEWLRFCGDYFTFKEAAVFCRMLGEGADGIILDNNTFTQGSGRFLDHHYICQSYNTNITQCRRIPQSNHSCILDTAIRCFNYSDVRIRIVGGNISSEGRMEIQIGEEWGTMCQRHYISTHEANVLCRSAMIGEYGVALQNRSFAPGSGRMWFHGLNCPFYARSLLDCQFNQIKSCNHDQDVGIRCFNDTGVSVRLVGGQNLYEGRLEIYFATEWGTVCNSSFTVSHASVMCRTLQFGSHGIPLQAGSIPPGRGRIWLDNIYCPRFAENISECSRINWGQSYCDHSRDVSIRCFNESDVAVRLVGGRNPYEGRLEVRYGGVWGTVCGSMSTRAVSLFCVVAGLGHYGTVLSQNIFPPGNGTIWLSSFRCPSYAHHILNCSHSDWGSAYCSHSSDVDIRCQNAIVCPNMTCDNRRQCYYASGKCDGYRQCDDGSDEDDCPTVRLVGGSSIYQGRLEVRHNGIWGTVCDDSFSNVDAAVFCRMLNYSEAGQVLSRSDYRTGRGRIWLDEVECGSFHRHINECSHRPWGLHNCYHYDDVGIGCYPTLSRDDVRLSDGNRSNEGRLEVRYNGEWVRFCGDYFTVNEAAVFCRMLGKGSDGIILENDIFGHGSGRFLDHYYECQSYHTNITQCRRVSRSYHSCHLESAIICFNSSDVGIRVVGGNISSEGRMEIQIGEEWGTMCQRHYISTYEANALCRSAMIGEYGVALQNTSFAPGSGRIWFHGLWCPLSARNLSDCQFNQIQSCSHDQDVGIRCFNDTGVSVRLVGSQNMYEGRLEIHFATEWGTVCNSSFTASKASVMCRMLHFGSHGIPLQAGSFPPGHGRIWLDNMYCPLHADHITGCSRINWGQTYCDHSRDVSIRCFNESDVAVRLVGGRTSFEGRLEVRYGGVWGTVCGGYLTTRAASLFCVAAGLGHYGTYLSRYSFPRGNGAIWLSSFTCPTDAQNIFDCSHSGWGSAYCTHSSDVGIRCRNAVVCSSLTCANRRQCYYSSDKCDGIADCDDGSDEADCPCRERDGAEFRCSNGRCVSWEVVCDGANDCRDNSDESHNCSSCSIGYFRCDGRCLPQFKRCDGSVDCFDTSDELSCECPDGEFRCGGYCYPPMVICQYNIECRSDLSLDCANLSTGPVPCGRPAITRGHSSSFIINGNEATPYSWPWQVSMVKYNIDGYWIHQCGGSLIDPCWVLTAAHCVDADIGSIRIRAGTHDQTGTVPFEETVGFQRVVVHPEYINFHNNDIALIQLSRCLPLSEKIGTICVPTSVVAADTTCTVTGWGRTEGTGDRRVLQEVDVSIVNQTYCRATWRNNNLTQSHLCATGTGVGVCYGDSGGPLVCLRNDRYEVHGIVSFGHLQPSCTESQRPDVYTRVTSFTPFIRSVIPTEASCANATADSRLLECDFEDGFCNFINESVANGWRRWAGSTPTSNTGPYSGYNGSRHYAYHESSQATTSRMVTPTLCTASGDSLCLSLCYHMFGSRVVKLSVTVGGKPVMTVSGNQANEWICRKAFVKSVARHTWVTFLAKSGYTTGDIAIDNVVIQKGSCI